MAGTLVSQTPESSKPAIESMSDFDELDDDMGVSAIEVADDDESESSKLSHLKSTDVRRRIEEKLEVRMLRDELGIDDFDL